MLEILLRNQYRIINLTDGILIGESVKMVNAKKANGINFNFTRNFPKDLNVVSDAEDIKSIQINDYDHKREFDYSVIQKLKSLEDLSIYTTDKREVDYSSFPLLKSTALFWRPKANSLFNSKQLHHLFIGKYNGQDLRDFKQLENLRYLRINTGAITTLAGIENLQSVEELLLMQLTKLESIRGVEQLRNLRFIRVDNCKKVNDLSLLKTLSSEPKIEIAGTTPSPE